MEVQSWKISKHFFFLIVESIFKTCVDLFMVICQNIGFIIFHNHTSIPLVIVFLLSRLSFEGSAPAARSWLIGCVWASLCCIWVWLVGPCCCDLTKVFGGLVLVVNQYEFCSGQYNFFLSFFFHTYLFN